LHVTSAILLAMIRTIFLFLLATLPVAAQTPAFQCGAATEPFLAKANRLLLAELALYPVEANQLGLHEYEGKSLDDQLDDYSPAAVEASRRLLNSGRTLL
jgi:hypothetical protein